jgi:hypothetical protein
MGPPTKRSRHAADLAAIGADPAAVGRYLRANSNLPGPRGNLELAHAFADWAPDELVEALRSEDTEQDEFVDFCVVLALGERLARAPDPGLVAALHEHARDPRWRIREAVATGLQRVGDRDLPRLVSLVDRWVLDEDPLIRRAAIAAVCEPRLLATQPGASAALRACQAATRTIAEAAPHERRIEGMRVLRQALGYCWSVAVAADPEHGLPAFVALQGAEGDADLAWITRENLRKARLQRLLQEGVGEPVRAERPGGPQQRP